MGASLGPSAAGLVVGGGCARPPHSSADVDALVAAALAELGTDWRAAWPSVRVPFADGGSALVSVYFAPSAAGPGGPALASAQPTRCFTT